MSLPEYGIDFNSLEKEIYKICCKTGREILKTVLESYDRALSTERDKGIYRHKGLRGTTIKTIMGEVEYERAIYEQKTDEGTKCYVYLLDEAMGIKGSGFFSGLMSEIISKASCEGTYREAARSVSELTGQTISHTAAWNVVQDLGERVDEQEQKAAALAANNQGVGELDAKVLFEEQDGIWLKTQGETRKKHGASIEMKVAIAYDGAKVTIAKKSGKKRRELTNKVACANFESTGKFQKRKEGVIAGTYNVDEIETRLVNGDGAAWIKFAAADDNAHFQLDPFHRNKAIFRAAPDENARKTMLKMLYSKEINELLIYIDALANSVEDEKQEISLRELHKYFTNNIGGLIPCKRRGLDLPQPPEGKEYTNMGGMESNIFTIIGNRMKGRRACWSVDGGNNLARLLCLKATKKLSETLQILTDMVLPGKYSEEIIVGFSSSKVANSVGKGYNGIHQAAAPATSDYKWLRNIGALQPLCEI